MTNILEGISNLGSAPVCDSNRIKPASLWRSGLAYGRTVGVRDGIYPVNYTISDLPVTLDVSSRMSVPWQTDWVAFRIMGAINSNRLPAFRSIRSHRVVSIRNNNRTIFVLWSFTKYFTYYNVTFKENMPIDCLWAIIISMKTISLRYNKNDFPKMFINLKYVVIQEIKGFSIRKICYIFGDTCC